MLPKLILGTAQFSDNYGHKKNYIFKPISAYKILNYSFQKKINYLDTAQNYGNAENYIGNYLDKTKKNFF